MVPTEVLVTVVLASFALLGGAFYALDPGLAGHPGSGRTPRHRTSAHDPTDRSRASASGSTTWRRPRWRISDLGGEVGGRLGELSTRMSALETRQHADMLDLREDLSGIRAALAGLDARVSTLER